MASPVLRNQDGKFEWHERAHLMPRRGWRNGRRPTSHGDAKLAVAPPGESPGSSPGVLYIAPSPPSIQATPTRLGCLKDRCPGPPPVFLPTPTNLFRPLSQTSPALDTEQPVNNSRVQEDRAKKIAKGRRVLEAWRRKQALQAVGDTPLPENDISQPQAECAIKIAAMQPNQDIDVSSAFALPGDRHCTAVSPNDSVFNGSSPLCSRVADVPTSPALPGQETGTLPEVVSDSSVQTGDRHRNAVPLNGIVTPDMPSPLDFRTVASSTVSSRTGRLTYPYALTTTPCTEALSTATGGLKALYAELGFSWCKQMLDAKQDYEEAIFGFDRSESTSFLPHPLNPPPLPPPSDPG